MILTLSSVMYIVAAILFALACFLKDGRLTPAGLAFLAVGHLM